MISWLVMAIDGNLGLDRLPLWTVSGRETVWAVPGQDD